MCRDVLLVSLFKGLLELSDEERCYVCGIVERLLNGKAIQSVINTHTMEGLK